jgi:S1-C subfamily serine protease
MTVLPDPPPDIAPPMDDAPVSDPRARTHRPAWTGRLVPFGAGLLVMLVVVLVAGAVRQPAPALTNRDVQVAIASALASQTPGPPASQLVYQAIRPSIVLIETTSPGAAGKPASGEGTGVVVTAQGEILTALHVVANATAVNLTFADGSRSTGTVTGRDDARDVAVVTPDALPAVLVPATLGNPGAMQIGSDAYIVGNPFGLYGSLSAGVVSGLERSFRDPVTDTVHDGLIQVDAAVNPGNSGGPLLDSGGRVVGIVTALINPTKQDVFIGIGLAVPIDAAGGGAGLPPY